MTIGASGAGPDPRSMRLLRVLTSLATIPEHVKQSSSVVPRDARNTNGETNGPASSLEGEAQNLVVEFDEAYTAYIEGFDRLPSESQMIALQAVDTKLSAMVGAKDAAIWTFRARSEDQIWMEVRELAAAVIGKFSWSAELDGASTQ